MGAANLRSGLMTGVTASAPTANFDANKTNGLRSGDPGNIFVYLYFARAFPLTAVIKSAKLHVWTQSYTQTGTHSITATRLAQKVNFAKVTYTTRPTQLHGTGPAVSKSGAQGAANEWVFDITAQMQAVSNGDPWYGWRLSSDFNPSVQVYAPNHPNAAVRPWVEVTWADNPATPIGLSPAGGRVVSLSNPVLRAVYHDVSGNTTLQAVQVQTSSSTSFTAPTWDSSTVTTSDPEIDTNVDVGNFPTVRTTSGSAAIVAATGSFSSADVGKSIVGLGIPAGTTITAVTDSTHATMSANATLTLGNELLTTDPSFEAGVNTFAAVGGATLTSSTTQAHTGTHSLAVAAGTASTANDAARSMTATAGVRYTFSGWIFVPATNTSLTGHIGASGAGQTSVVMSEVTAGSWQFQTLTYDALSAASMAFNLYGSGTIGETVYFDDLSLQAAPSAVSIGKWFGLPVGASTWWRIRMQDGAGLWSPWSDPETFTRDDKGTLTVQNPPDGGGPTILRQTFYASKTAAGATGISYSSSAPTANDPGLNCSPGDQVYASVWVKTPRVMSITLFVQFMDSANTQMQSTSIIVSGVAPGAPVQVAGLSGIAPAGTARVRLLAYQTGTASSEWFQAGDMFEIAGLSCKKVGGTGAEMVANPSGGQGLLYLSSTAGTGAQSALTVQPATWPGDDTAPVDVTDPTPPINWTLTGETQKAYQVSVQEAVDPAAPKRTRPTWTTGKITSTDTSITLPKGVLAYSGPAYNLTVRVWDTDNRESTPGDPVYTEVRRTFRYTPSSIVGAVTSLVATQPNSRPATLLSWSRSTAPDSFTIIRNGRVIESGLDPLDVSTGGINYAWTDSTPSPQRPLTYEVRAVQNGVASKGNNTSTIILQPYGIWLRDLTSGDEIVISNNESSADFTLAEQTSVVQPIADNAPKVLLTQSQGVLEGSVSGYLLGSVVPGFTDQGMRDSYIRMRNTAGRQFYLSIGDYTFIVVANSFTYQQFVEAAGQTIYRVSFNFYQQDSLTSLQTAG